MLEKESRKVSTGRSTALHVRYVIHVLTHSLRVE